jgi:hypothetical protein
MNQKRQPAEKPDLSNVPMHLPEGGVVVAETEPGKHVAAGPI